MPNAILTKRSVQRSSISSTAWLLSSLFVAVACAPDPKDRDADGALDAEDCAPADPFVYPGAPDTPGDGLDSDCDGVDPGYDYLGAWTLTRMEATYSGLEIILPDTTSGTLALGLDTGVLISISGGLNPEVLGRDLTVQLDMTGNLEPGQRPDELILFAQGENFGEQMHVDWDCWMEGADALSCEGELKALDFSLSALATYLRE